MIGYSSGELTVRPAQWKVSLLNSKRTKQFLQSQAFGVSKSPKPKSALTSGLEASGSGMNSELDKSFNLVKEISFGGGVVQRWEICSVKNISCKI
jgi:hypothetical protein